MPVKIDDDVKAVLEAATMTETSVDISSAGQLDRKLYMKVNKALEAAGGAWNRKARVHLFQEDPRSVLGMALEVGSITSKKQDLQQFFTPAALAEDVVPLACIDDTVDVLEPECGDCALAREILKYRPRSLTLVEIDPPTLANGFRSLEPGGTEVTSRRADFLTLRPESLPKFDAVVMNPPFTKGQDVRHVTHALQFVKPGGRLVAIMSPAWQTTDHAAYAAFRFKLRKVYPDHEVIENPEGSFKESGTNVRTITLLVRAPAADARGFTEPETPANPKPRGSLRDRVRGV